LQTWTGEQLGDPARRRFRLKKKACPGWMLEVPRHRRNRRHGIQNGNRLLKRGAQGTTFIPGKGFFFLAGASWAGLGPDKEPGHLRFSVRYILRRRPRGECPGKSTLSLDTGYHDARRRFGTAVCLPHRSRTACTRARERAQATISSQWFCWPHFDARVV